MRVLVGVSGYCYSSVEDFDKARQAHGTDEDVLEVNLEIAPLNTT